MAWRWRAASSNVTRGCLERACFISAAIFSHGFIPSRYAFLITPSSIINTATRPLLSLLMRGPSQTARFSSWSSPIPWDGFLGWSSVENDRNLPGNGISSRRRTIAPYFGPSDRWRPPSLTNLPSPNTWKQLFEKTGATVFQLLSILLDVLLIIGWLFLLHCGRMGFDWVEAYYGPDFRIDHTEEWILDAGHAVMTWATLLTVVLYIASDFAMLAKRKIREFRQE